ETASSLSGLTSALHQTIAPEMTGTAIFNQPAPFLKAELDCRSAPTALGSASGLDHRAPRGTHTPVASSNTFNKRARSSARSFSRVATSKASKNNLLIAVADAAAGGGIGLPLPNVTNLNSIFVKRLSL